jgi:hypothetical protein
MPPVIGDKIRVAARTTLSGVGDFVNVYHFLLDTGILPSDNQVLLDVADIMDALYDVVKDFFPTNLSFVDVNAFDVTQNRPLGSTPWPNLTAGTNNAETLPGQLCTFIRGTTGFSRNWAKKFIGPLTEQWNGGDGFITNAALAKMVLFGAEWLLSTATPIGTYVPIVHYATTNTWQPITDTVFDNRFAVQRRRRAKVGS